MSEPIAIAFILVYPVALHFLYVYHNKYMSDLFHVVSTGTVNGVSMSTKKRWATLNNHYSHQCIAAILITILFGILEVLVARTISNAAFRYFGYLHAVAIFVTVISVTGLSMLNYRHLASVLREAEAE